MPPASEDAIDRLTSAVETLTEAVERGLSPELGASLPAGKLVVRIKKH